MVIKKVLNVLDVLFFSYRYRYRVRFKVVLVFSVLFYTKNLHKGACHLRVNQQSVISNQ